MTEPDGLASLITCLQSESEGIEHSNALKPYQRVARWFPVAVGPFINIDMAIYAGAATLNCSEPPPDAEEGDMANFELILKICPDLKRVLKGFDGQPDLLKCLIGHLSTAASNARAEDTSSCRKAAPDYFLWAHLAEPIRLNIDKKSDRGWNNRHTARLLCSLKRLPEFDRNPTLFMGKVLDGTIKPSAIQWPSFLYPKDTVYNPTSIDEGLFRGPTIIYFLRIICTGPTSASDGIRKASKRSKAEINGMERVFGRCVAYAAVQTYFALSSVEQWSSTLRDSYFKLDDFFYRCVDLFERDPDDPWVIETLDYLTSQLPSLKRSYSRKRKRDDRADDDSNSEDDETEAIFLQREARRLERSVNEASSNGTGEDSGSSAGSHSPQS